MSIRAENITSGRMLAITQYWNIPEEAVDPYAALTEGELYHQFNDIYAQFRDSTGFVKLGDAEPDETGRTEAKLLGRYVPFPMAASGTIWSYGVPACSLAVERSARPGRQSSEGRAWFSTNVIKSDSAAAKIIQAGIQDWRTDEEQILHLSTGWVLAGGVLPQIEDRQMAEILSAEQKRAFGVGVEVLKKLRA